MVAVAEHIKVPVLRFPEFPGEWEEKRLERLVSTFEAGDFISASEIKINSHYPVYGGNGIRGFFEEYNFCGESCLIGRQGALCGNVLLVGDKFWATEHAIVPRAEKNGSTNWLYYLLFRAKLNRWSESSAQPGLSAKKLLRLKFWAPLLPEQQKIAEFLTAVDEKIGKLKRKKELLEAYKKGAMQKLFSQEIRFKDDQGNPYPDWEEKRLEEIGQTYAGLSGKSKEDFGSGVPYVQYMQVFSNTKIRLEDCDFVRVAANEKQNTVLVGDALFTTSSETPTDIGTCSVLTVSPPTPIYLNSFCFGYRLDIEANPAFLAYLFHSPGFREKMIPLAQGSTRFNLSKSNFLKLNTTFPTLPEQQKIAEFLTGIDDKITAVANQIDKAAEFKKGLLQKMFV